LPCPIGPSDDGTDALAVVGSNTSCRAKSQLGAAFFMKAFWALAVVTKVVEAFGGKNGAFIVWRPSGNPHSG